MSVFERWALKSVVVRKQLQSHDTLILFKLWRFDEYVHQCFQQALALLMACPLVGQNNFDL